MNLRRCAAAVPLAAISMVFWASAGCSRPAAAPPPPPPAAAAASPPFESMQPAPDWVRRRAQRTWCGYLEALYHRATTDGSAWAERARCDADTSATASPEMLERTAGCSQKALDAFQGDPFDGDGYAAEVKRCGAEVVDAMTLPEADVEPYAVLACARASTCGAEGDPCQGEGATELRSRLGRALGVLNPESRIALRRCLQTVECQDAGKEVSVCLEPILDRLFWTPR